MFTSIRYNNAEASVIKLIKILNIDILPETIVYELEKHPDYPSLLAISDVLTALHIENFAFRVAPDQLLNIPCPFLAHTNINGGDFIVVNSISTEKVITSGDKWNRHVLSLDEFKKIFKGIALTAQASAEFTATTPTLSNFIAKIKAPAVLTCGALMFSVALVFHSDYFTGLSWQSLLLTLFKSAGIITSVLLLIQFIDSNNTMIQKLCQSGGGKTDCNAILSSKAAKVFEGLSWSEVGFFYFTGTLLLLLFGDGSAFIWQALALLNLVSLPYTVYSIYYQARVVKKWCVLCCAVQVLLWLEFIPLLAKTNWSIFFFTPTGNNVSTLFICLLLPVILWVILKPLLLKLQQLSPLKQQLRTFKYNTELFNVQLTIQPKYTLPDEEWSIILGNVEANNVITMVTNPYCQPCAQTHKLLDELLNQNDNVQARVVFMASNSETDIKTPVTRHMMALYDLPDKTIVREAMHDWYKQKQKSYETWAKAYPVEIKEAGFFKIDRQREWCNMGKITATPVLLLNGYRLPDLYQLPDLKYMLQ
jgi:uncharacterized membrane protein